MKERHFITRSGAVALLCLLLGLSLSLFLRPPAERQSERLRVYTVHFYDEALNAQDMERLCVLPLEERCSRLPDMVSLRSSSADASAWVSVSFRGGSDPLPVLRKELVALASTLPGSSSWPQLQSMSPDRVPVWAVALAKPLSTAALQPEALRRILETHLAPLAAHADYELFGLPSREYHIVAQSALLSRYAVSLSDFSAALTTSDAVALPAVTAAAETGALPIHLDTRSKDISALAGQPLRIGSFSGRAKELAEFRVLDAEQAQLPALDGNAINLVYVYAANEANLISLSSRLSPLLKELEETWAVTELLLDTGAEKKKDMIDLLISCTLSMLLCAAAMALLSMGGRVLLVCAAAVPCVLLFSSALLAAFGFPPSSGLFAALSVSLGSALDALILSAWALGGSGKQQAAARLSSVFPALLGGAATSILALTPFILSPHLPEGLSELAAAMCAIILLSLALSQTLLPALLQGPPALLQDPPALRLEEPARRVRWWARSLARISRFCARRAVWILSASALLAVAALWALCVAEPEQPVPAPDRVELLVSFEPGTRQELCTERLCQWAREVRSLPGVLSVQTLARSGSGSASLKLDTQITNREQILPQLLSMPPQQGALFQPPSAGAREIRISGEDPERCAQFATEAARMLSLDPRISAVSLGFKDGAPQLVLQPTERGRRLSAAQYAQALSHLRAVLLGPVLHKRQEAAQIRDVRFMLDAFASVSPAALAALPLPLGINAAATVAELFSFSLETPLERRNRENRLPGASIFIWPQRYAKAAAFRADVQKKLAALKLPASYHIEVDAQGAAAEQEAQRLRWYFALAAICVYCTLLVVHNSFTKPLPALIALAPALAVPILLRVSSGFGVYGGCALVAVCGLAVNAVLLMEFPAPPLNESAAPCPGFAIYHCLRKKAAPLCATCGTSVLSCLPFLFLPERAHQLEHVLSGLMVPGLLASAAAAVFVVPALYTCFPALFGAKPYSRRRLSRTGRSLSVVSPCILAKTSCKNVR